MATALALLDLPDSAEYPLPPLECLFTVDEETGLTGAFDLDPTLLTGTSPTCVISWRSRHLIWLQNLARRLFWCPAPLKSPCSAFAERSTQLRSTHCDRTLLLHS